VVSESRAYECKKVANGFRSEYLGEELNQPPGDGITSLSFPELNDELLLATSWDKQAYLYNTTSKELVTSFEHHAPILDGVDINANVKTLCGKHAGGIKCVNFFDAQSEGAHSAGWDKKLKVWNPRDSSQLAHSVQLNGKAYSMDTSGPFVVVAEIRPDRPYLRKKSPLQFASRCIRINPKGTSYALSSIEGRIAVESMGLSAEVRATAYKLRCHQRETDAGFESYPVNALCFNPRNDTLLSGGDGEVAIWNIQASKQVHRYGGYPTSISDIAVSTNGRFLAVAASYTWEQGNKQHPPDRIYIHRLEDDLKALGLASEVMADPKTEAWIDLAFLPKLIPSTSANPQGPTQSIRAKLTHDGVLQATWNRDALDAQPTHAQSLGCVQVWERCMWDLEEGSEERGLSPWVE
ncbi:hypothetical protein L0F63_005492, partial [Massospora cicadina]